MGKSAKGEVMTQTQRNTDAEASDIQAIYDREGDRLEDVLAWIDRQVAYMERPHMTSAGDVRAADMAVALSAARLRELRQNRPKPYFGRVDYTDDNTGEVKTAYIGYFSSGISGTPNSGRLNPPVVDRNAPIASLYYDPSGSSLKLPRQTEKDVSVYLKRMLTIEQAAIHKIEDVLRLDAPTEQRQLPTSEILDERLSAASAGVMSDAVQTIQPEQYRAIASTAKPVIIVQGAAGSGKSLIGLHRIDYILSPHSDIGTMDRPTVDRIIMFGPSPAFLQYASNLLPGLGVQGVQQSTVEQWILEQFSARVTPSRTDRVFDDLMNNRRQLRETEIEAHQFKGSMKMKRLLDGYIQRLTQEIKRYIKQRWRDLPLDLSESDFKRRIDAAFVDYPQPNVARQYVINTLAEIWARSESDSARGRRPIRRGETRYDLVSRGRRLVERALTSWPNVDFRRVYAGLMSDPDRLVELAKGDLDPEIANEISRTASNTQAGQALGLTDMAAALYLDYALNGVESKNYQHIVVDEAQDVSPLELELMRMHSVNQSFTILGDLRQSLLRYKSITNWYNLASIFDAGATSRLESRLTYRSTRQITQYTNRILQGLPARTKMPTPYTRAGERPRLIRSKSATNMNLTIAMSIQALRENDNVKSIAVLTKWRTTADKLGALLTAADIPGVTVLQADKPMESDIIVSPTILTKGLEFDAVIVANAGKNNYNETEFDRMLLYLACTRARHYLEIHWHGSRSPIVPDTARLQK